MIMAVHYNPHEFEPKWRETWERRGIYKTVTPDTEAAKIYTLSMFPYPSGAGLHVGHVRIYTGTDVLARYLRMKGYAVLHPMGWDAFGLPAENAAIKEKKNPLDMVPAHIQNFKRQMKMLGLSYDWEREIATIDPDYYQWTQWLFILFFKLGLLYKKGTFVYFCPFCKTGLAEEEVLADGTHERCGKPITRKELPQWIFRITTYADSLLEGLEALKWPRGILEMQKNWIGKKDGVRIKFKIQNSKFKTKELEVFTTRIDTIFGVTFVVVAPEKAMAWIRAGWKASSAVREYVDKALSKTDQARLEEQKEKSGVKTDLSAVNPVNGEEVPIYVADYVIDEVGTGCVMGVPFYDERDKAFAEKYGIEIKPIDLVDKGQTYRALKEKGMADQETTYHLRDWIFSRQRYWGEPIPMVYCSSCAQEKLSWFDTGEAKRFKKQYHNMSKLYQSTKENVYGWYPLPDEELPLKLPYLKEYEPTESGESPLAKVSEWKETVCPHCGGPATRETDTMPNWAGSCWYFIRFAWQNAKQESPSIENWKLNIENSPWLPVDWYLGGAEHAVLHLLYSRFWAHVLHDVGLLGFREPFLRLRNVGMVLAEDHRKMSKSFGNVINPDDVVAKYGADALRVYEMFMAPFNMEIDWSTRALAGAYRFLKRIYQIYHESANIANDVSDEDIELVAKLNKTISKVDNDITNVKFNTAIAALMEFTNAWQAKKLGRDNAKKFLIMLAPFAPFLAEELWSGVMKGQESVHEMKWPEIDRAVLKDETVSLPVQIDGKVRGLVKLGPGELAREQAVARALTEEKVNKHLAGKKYRTIYVEGKVLNFVTE